jgi:hypothetical protein
MSYTVSVLDRHPYGTELHDTEGWRTQTRQVTAAMRIPTHRHIALLAQPFHTTRARVTQAGNAWPAVHAMIRGLIDAGTIPNANADVIHSVTLDAPVITGRSGIALEIHDVTDTIPAVPTATWLLVPLDAPTYAAMATRFGTVNHDELGRHVAAMLAP